MNNVKDYKYNKKFADMVLNNMDNIENIFPQNIFNSAFVRDVCQSTDILRYYTMKHMIFKGVCKNS